MIRGKVRESNFPVAVGPSLEDAGKRRVVSRVKTIDRARVFNPATTQTLIDQGEPVISLEHRCPGCFLAPCFNRARVGCTPRSAMMSRTWGKAGGWLSSSR